MEIHFDDIIYALQPHGGISTFWNEVTRRVRSNNNISIVTSRGSKLSRFSPVMSSSDIFHSSYFRTPLSYNKNVKQVVTVHDLIYEELVESNKKINILLNVWQRQKAIENADAIVCVSNATKKYLLEFYPSLQSKELDIHVIYHGISFSKDKLNNDLDLSIRLEELFYTTNKKYVMFVGGRKAYKNFDLALKGFANSKLYKESGYCFVCTGKQFDPEEIELIQDLQLSNSVKVMQNATTEEIKCLYDNSHALLYISSQEGFGIPPLEAMSRKCPVITSKCEAVLEIVDRASIVIDTDDVSSISSSIDLLADDSVRQKYISLGELRVLDFDWKIAANKYLEVYQSLMGKE